MKKYNKIFIIFAVILLLIITTKLYHDSKVNNELKILIIQNEIDSLSSFIDAFRSTYQKAFIENKIPINDKTVNLLPVKTIKLMGEKFAKSLDDRALIRTVSDRPRNIENQANLEDLKIIEYFNTNIDKKSYFKILDNQTYYYAKPLYIKKSCLRCHGKKENAPFTIQQRYDKSYNYKLGELRGITTIKIIKEDINDMLSNNYIRNIKIGSTIYILFLLSIYLMIRIIIKNQDDYAKTLEDKVIKRTSELDYEKANIETIVESNNNAIISINWNGIITTYNNKAQDIFGWTKEEMIGTRNLLRVVPPNYKEAHTKALANYFKTGKLSGVFENSHQAEGINKNGNIFPIRISIGAKFRSKDTILIANIVDISQEKEQEKLIYQQSKMVAMGEMIGNIAHQWRQPLSFISSASTGMMVQKEFDLLTDEIFIDSCTKINNNAQYLSKTIDDFRNFIKGDRVKKLFHLSSCIENLLSLIDGSIKKNGINIILDLDKNIEIDGYENEIIQSLINIFNNAIDALQENEIKDKYIFISTIIDDKNITIKIKDNAQGIPSKVLPKIFEAYFTTKHKNQGTGLGLHMTYKLIVDGMKGDIQVTNKEYQYKDENFRGAEFKILLPK